VEIMDRFSMVSDDSTTIRIRDAIIKQLRIEEEESDEDQECRS